MKFIVRFRGKKLKKKLFWWINFRVHFCIAHFCNIPMKNTCKCKILGLTHKLKINYQDSSELRTHSVIIRRLFLDTQTTKFTFRVKIWTNNCTRQLMTLWLIRQVTFAGCRMLQHPANRTHNPQLHTRPATWKPQHEIPQAATTV